MGAIIPLARELVHHTELKRSSTTRLKSFMKNGRTYDAILAR